MTLRARRLTRAVGPARLADYLPPDGAASLLTDGRERWLCTHRRQGDRHTEDRHVLRGENAAAVDRTVFWIPADRFVEAERYTTADGPNLHALPIALPARLDPGECVATPTGRVTLAHSGPTRVTFEGRSWDTDAIALVGEEGAAAHVQWLVRGVGVVALGPLGRAPTRWVVGCAATAPWPWQIPPELLSLPRLPLPAGPPDTPRARLL